MNIKTFLFDDDRGVSPVIGVILMVAITVILAAVVAAFVLGFGDTNSTAPSVTWDYDLNETASSEPGELTIQHESGETVDNSTISFGGDAYDSVNTTAGSNTFSDTVTAGDSITVDIPSDPEPGEEVNIIFQSEDGGTSSTIGTFELPSDYE